MTSYQSVTTLIGLFLISALAMPQLCPAQNNDNTFTSADAMPELHGSLDSLQQELNYPDKAVEKGIEGTVMVQLIVNKKGKVEDPRILRGIGAGCDKEVLVRPAKMDSRYACFIALRYRLDWRWLNKPWMLLKNKRRRKRRRVMHM